MGELVHQQHMNLRALEVEPVLLVLTVAQVDAAPVREADLLVDQLGRAVRRPRGEKRAETLGPFEVVLRKFRVLAAEQVDLQTGDRGGPGQRRRPHQIGLAAPRGASVQHLGRRCREGNSLLGPT